MYRNANLWVYCNEDSSWFVRYCNPGVGAIFAYETEAVFSPNWYITFCSPFFDKKWRLPLSDLINIVNTNKWDKTAIELYTTPGTQAATIFHETFHFSQLVTSPQAVDFARGPKGVWDLARNRNTAAAVLNADSWSITGQAIWAQKEWGLAYPPYPIDYHPRSASNGSVPLYNASSSVGDIIYVITDPFCPLGVSINSEGRYVADPEFWEIYHNTSGASEAAQSVHRGY